MSKQSSPLGAIPVTLGKIPPNVFLYGILTIVVIFLLVMISKRTGLWRSRQQKKIDRDLTKLDGEQDIEEATVIDDLNTSKWFNPNEWRNAPSSNLLSPNETMLLFAKNINRSIQWWGDNEERIYLQFRSLKNKWQISQLVDAFGKLTGNDLVTELIDNLNEKELVIIKDIISQLPTNTNR